MNRYKDKGCKFLKVQLYSKQSESIRQNDEETLPYLEIDNYICSLIVFNLDMGDTLMACAAIAAKI